MNADSPPSQVHLLPPFFELEFSKAEEYVAKLGQLLEGYRSMESQRVRQFFRREWLRWNQAGMGPAADAAAKASLETFTDYLERSVFADLAAMERKLQATIQKIQVSTNELEAAISPADAQTPGPADYLPHESLTLEFLLRREGLLPRAQGVPKPIFAPATGQAGKSRVYHLFVPAESGNRYLVAKFDQKGRDSREWAQIENMRKRNLPGIVFPLANNRQGDGVIVAEAAGTPDAQRFLSLAEYFRRSLKSSRNLVSCCQCLDLAFDALDKFYSDEPGHLKDSRKERPLHWSDIFPGLEEMLPVALSAASNAWTGVDWATSTAFEWTHAATSRSLPNPFFAFPNKWRERTFRLWLSRTHGDLNLTNLLVCILPDGSPQSVLVIDVAESQPDQAAAVDFAFLEAQFWNEVFFDPSQNVDALFGAFADLRDRLDGRLPIESPPPANCILVWHLRHLAYRRLAGGLAPGYVLNDFFHALYFSFVRILTFSTVQRNPAQVRLNLLGAALSLQVLDDIEQGFLYMGTDGYRRPWENPPNFQSANGRRP